LTQQTPVEIMTVPELRQRQRASLGPWAQ